MSSLVSIKRVNLVWRSQGSEHRVARVELGSKIKGSLICIKISIIHNNTSNREGEFNSFTSDDNPRENLDECTDIKVFLNDTTYRFAAYHLKMLGKCEWLPTVKNFFRLANFKGEATVTLFATAGRS